MSKGDGDKKSIQASLNTLRDKALEFGAVSAQIIPVDKIVVEDRVVLKCKLGCQKYGKTLSCPPHAPTPEQFRKIVKEYKYALLVQFDTEAEADAELKGYLNRTDDDPTVPAEMKQKIRKFWSAWNEETKRELDVVLKLEKAAAHEGFLLAAGFVAGACQLCAECNVEKGYCVHPQMRRFSEEGVGVNVKATAEKAGMKFMLPFEKNPQSYALLLID